MASVALYAWGSGILGALALVVGTAKLLSTPRGRAVRSFLWVFIMDASWVKVRRACRDFARSYLMDKLLGRYARNASPVHKRLWDAFGFPPLDGSKRPEKRTSSTTGAPTNTPLGEECVRLRARTNSLAGKMKKAKGTNPEEPPTALVNPLDAIDEVYERLLGRKTKTGVTEHKNISETKRIFIDQGTAMTMSVHGFHPGMGIHAEKFRVQNMRGAVSVDSIDLVERHTCSVFTVIGGLNYAAITPVAANATIKVTIHDII